ncbi:arylsulfatase [Coprobacillus sp. CAG:698]|nr:arylsulfatase [Coprobacillus sp. CAG:698]
MYKNSIYNYSIIFNDGSLRMYNSMIGNRSLICVMDPKKSKMIKNVLDGKDSYEILPENIIKVLVKYGYLVLKEKDEDKELEIKIAETICGEKFLSLIILPTEQCNFRCKYCYEKLKKGKMSEETQNSLIDFVRKNISKYIGLSVSWFGGEPLEALDVVENLSKKFIEICKIAKKTYVAGITTNGYNLDSETFDKLYKLKVLSYQITLDGYKTEHDRQRILENGKGSFEKIIANLKIIKSKNTKGTTIIIRTNFTKSIIDNIDKYLIFYKENFGNDMRFSFYIQKASDWGGKQVANFSNELIRTKNSGDVHKYVLKKLKEHDIYLSNSSHYSELQCELNTCYAAKLGHLVIGSDGIIYKCTRNFELPENNVGQLDKNGHIIFNNNYSKWINPLKTKSKKCEKCFNRASCLPMKCPYQNLISEENQCPPMGGYNLYAFLERFHISLFTKI